MDSKGNKTYKTSDGITYSYYFRPAQKATIPTLLFLHGFPQGSYCWRHNIAHFEMLGYGILAPELLGYGGTDKPTALEEYLGRKQADQLVDILNHEELKKVIVVCHDWGAMLAGRFQYYYAQYLLGLIFLQAPYNPPRSFDISAINAYSEKKLGYPMFGYWEFFVRPDAPQLIFDHLDSFLCLFFADDPTVWRENFCPFGRFEKWLKEDRKCEIAKYLTEEDRAHYKSVVISSLPSALLWYRSQFDNIHWKLADHAIPKENYIIKVPVLFVGAGKDQVVPGDANRESMKPFVDAGEGGYESVVLDAGHWIMEERAVEVNETLEKWLKNKGLGVV